MFFIRSTGPATTHLALTARTGRLQTAVKLQSKAQQPQVLMSFSLLFCMDYRAVNMQRSSHPVKNTILKDLLESHKSFNLSALCPMVETTWSFYS